ncbi:hypothetical protein [Tateyamaria sp.]|uniref:hypothetical protein n=1 Tax=Tateyamaria sp. TaxID=1929288 RepID=UPI0032A049B7
MSWDEVDINREMQLLLFERDAIEPFEQKMFRVWTEVNEVLNRHLGTNFSKLEDFIPAAILYNPFDATGPIWGDVGKAYGAKRIREAIGLLSESAVILEGEVSLQKDESSCESGVRALRLVEEYTGPIWWQLREFVTCDDRLLLEAINVLIEHFDDCLSNPERSKGNYQAFRIAAALRAIFEVHTDLKVTSGDKGYSTVDGWADFASGPFCKCLKDLYCLIGVKAGYRHFATEAKKLTDDHMLLQSYKYDLIRAPSLVRSDLENSSFTA